MSYRFLFFVEREFHLSLFKEIINYIKTKDLGDCGIFIPPYSGNSEGKTSYGIRDNTITDYAGVKTIDNPEKYAPDFTFVCDSSYEKVEGLGKIVSIGHGTISKGSFYTDSLLMRRENCADLVCVPGNIHKEQLSRNVYQPIVVSGIPKLDRLLRGELDRKQILAEMSLNPTRKTILFAPTFNPELSLVPFISYNLRNYIPDYFNIIVKLHGVAPQAWKDGFSQFCANDKNAYYHTGHDISNCFSAADILITDVSSVIYEFAITQKPILLFDSPLQSKLPKYNPNDPEYRYRDIGFTFNNPEQIPRLLLDVCLSKRKSPSEIASLFISRTLGDSAEYVVNETLKLKQIENRIALLCDNKLVSQRFLSYCDVYPLTTDLSKISNECIVYLVPKARISPLTPRLLQTHLHFNADIELISPLISNKIQERGINLAAVSQTPNSLTDDQIAWSISYQFPGKYIMTESFNASCFAFRKGLLQKIGAMEARNINTLIKKFQENSCIRKAAAMDCYLW